MRVISGEYGGRRLKAVPGDSTRPTTDKIKEAVFHMIGPYFDGGNVLDLYSGSGSLGIEAVSRGMDHAVLVDSNYKAIQIIKENIQMTKEPDKFTVLKKKDRQALAELESKGTAFDLILLDPPYALQEISDIINELSSKKLISPKALILCETDKSIELPQRSAGMEVIKEKVYGTTKITVYEAGELS
ncbi:16S rRNA (guanine(966)-N(2))-methyltransferase RsmD [Marinilactibacillus piezotolerans]|uniref:16S rRNA (guanine(966)-N(2))-methyltransferase RsmD n=1 Tax=Marinilactibacillus piezotolerans TaxID=258723 RepID=UPI0009AF34F0|nr:16S rRNA (guanine(966)-N(2))-methyltransferase RsmD [Marinilactibacillus piezotolerans]